MTSKASGAILQTTTLENLEPGAKPFCFPGVKVAVQLCDSGLDVEQNRQYTVSLTSEIRLAVELIKEVLKLRNKNFDFQGGMVPMDATGLIQLSHKQQLDALNQLLALESGLSASEAGSPESLSATASAPLQKKQAEKIPATRLACEEKKDSKHHRHHRSRTEKRWSPCPRCNGVAQATGELPAQLLQTEKVVSTQKIVAQKQLAKKDTSLLMQLDEQLRRLEQSLSVSDDNAIPHTDLAEEIEQKMRLLGKKEAQTQAAPCHVRMAMYLPVMNTKKAMGIKRELRQFQQYTDAFDSRSLGPALLRARMRPSNIHLMLSDEILEDLIDQTVVEFGLMVKEVVLQQ